MKILIVHYRYFISGGPERYLFNVKNALEEMGHTVIPFSIKNSRNEKSEYEEYFVRNIGDSDEVFVNKYPKTIKTYLDLVDREFYSFHVKNKLEQLIKEEKPDICYLLAYKRALSPSVIDICKKYNIPVINRISDYNTVCGNGSLYRDGKFCDMCLENDKYCLSYNCIKGSKVFSLMRYLSIKLHNAINIHDKISAYVCTNQYMAEMMYKYGYDSKKLTVIPTFFKEDNDIKSWNKSNNVNINKINFLFIGNIDETKGIYDLLEALTFLKKEVTNFHLYIVGGLHFEENERVMSLVNENKLNDHITFVPFMSSKEVYRFYLRANVVILPARWVENLPNTLVESIYFNRPVVIPNYGSFKYTTDESVSFSYKALSSNSLYKQLLNICKDPEQIREKSQNCSQYFIKHYSEDTHMKKLIRLFEESKQNEDI